MLKISGIKCDNKLCGYKDDAVTREEYPQYINKPCPSCGNPLLTQADFDVVVKMEKITNSKLIKGISKILGWFGKKESTAEIKMDGSGKVDVHIKDKK